ncbi:hypothetical protein A5696_21435 [Mycobacterium sp. E2699]|nr:hypothetical protein A5696_21435 [Mycobacterium sp. E2699]
MRAIGGRRHGIMRTRGHRHRVVRTTRSRCGPSGRRFRRWFLHSTLRRRSIERLWLPRRTRHPVRWARHRLDRRLQRLRRRQAHGAAADRRRLDLGQLPGNALKILGQVTTDAGDICQSAACTRDTCNSIDRSTGGTLGVHSGLGSTGGRPTGFRGAAGFTGARNEEHRDIEGVLPETQPRSRGTPIIKVQQAFQLLPVGLDELLRVEDAIDQASLPQAFTQARPCLGGAVGIDEEPPRVEIPDGQRHSDGALQGTLIRVGEDVENCCHLIADGITQKLLELAAHVLFQFDDQTVDDP